MSKIRCISHGFDCKFEIDLDDSDAINRFKKHSKIVHGFEYNSGTINQILVKIRDN